MFFGGRPSGGLGRCPKNLQGDDPLDPDPGLRPDPPSPGAGKEKDFLSIARG